jgi:hypothetical protein
MSDLVMLIEMLSEEQQTSYLLANSYFFAAEGAKKPGCGEEQDNGPDGR